MNGLPQRKDCKYLESDGNFCVRVMNYPILEKLKTNRCIVCSATTISHEEKDLKELRVGTADLLDMLIEAQNGSQMEDEFTFALGSDTFLDLTNWKWRRSKDIFKLINFRILVIQRLSPSSSSSTQEEDLVSESVLKQRIEDVYSQMADEGIKVEVNSN